VHGEQHRAGQRREHERMNRKGRPQMSGKQKPRGTRQPTARAWQAEHEGERTEGNTQQREQRRSGSDDEKDLTLAGQEGADFFPFTSR